MRSSTSDKYRYVGFQEVVDSSWITGKPEVILKQNSFWASAATKLSAQSYPERKKKLGLPLEPRSSDLMTRLALHQDDAGVIVQTRAVGEPERSKATSVMRKQCPLASTFP